MWRYSILTLSTPNSITTAHSHRHHDLHCIYALGMPHDGKLEELQKLLLDKNEFKPPNAEGDFGTQHTYRKCID